MILEQLSKLRGMLLKLKHYIHVSVLRSLHIARLHSYLT